MSHFWGPCEHQNHVQCPVSHIVAKAHDSPWRGHGTPDPWHHPDSNSWSEFDTSQHVGASTLKNGGRNNGMRQSMEKKLGSMILLLNSQQPQCQGSLHEIMYSSSVFCWTWILGMDRGKELSSFTNPTWTVELGLGLRLHLMSACLHGDAGTVKWNGYAWLWNTS